jgi:hypothetical protein
MRRRVIGGVFVVGAVLLGLFAAVNFVFKAASWHGFYTFYALGGTAADGIGAVACVIAARKYLSPVPIDHDLSAPAEAAS